MREDIRTPFCGGLPRIFENDLGSGRRTNERERNGEIRTRQESERQRDWTGRCGAVVYRPQMPHTEECKHYTTCHDMAFRARRWQNNPGTLHIQRCGSVTGEIHLTARHLGKNKGKEEEEEKNEFRMAT